MWTFSTLREQSARPGEGVTRLYTIVRSQPSWVTRAALGVGLLAFTGVVLLLVVPALVLAAAAFLVLAAFTSARRFLRRLFRLEPGGRRNVRVIVRQ